MRRTPIVDPPSPPGRQERASRAAVRTWARIGGLAALCGMAVPADLPAQSPRSPAVEQSPVVEPAAAQGVATFSILGYDPATGEMGAAVQSRVFSVGNGVLWAEAGVGVVATQAIVDVSYGPQALRLLASGLDASETVAALLRNDPNPDPVGWPVEGRQVAVMDASGHVAVHTGPRATAWSGHRVGRHVAAQGNILAGPEVVDAMVQAFESTKGHLSLRLQAALEAGQAAGGDTRGMQSAAMLVVKEKGGVWLNNDVVLRLQVDDHPSPITELRRLVELAATQRVLLRGGR